MAGRVQAVNGLSLRVRPGSTVALVGESGSGKSVTAQAILGILPRTAHITGGEILFNDQVGGMRRPRGAVAALEGVHGDPRQPHRHDLPGADDLLLAAPHDRRPDRRGARRAPDGQRRRRSARRTIEMLRLVEFPRPAETIDSYPFELSGGLRQRAMIAMALICRPALLIADEPTTALDVTVQAQILKLIRDLQSELGMAVLLITHDLGVVANMAEEVVVAHHGRVVEAGTLDDIFTQPEPPLPEGAAEGGAAFRHEAGRAAEADPRDHDAGRRIRWQDRR